MKKVLRKLAFSSGLPFWFGLLPLGLPMLLFASKRVRGAFSSLAQFFSRLR